MHNANRTGKAEPEKRKKMNPVEDSPFLVVALALELISDQSLIEIYAYHSARTESLALPPAPPPAPSLVVVPV